MPIDFLDPPFLLVSVANSRDITMSQYLGTWYNQLKSRMVISTAENGLLAGRYESAVGDAEGEYELIGRYNTTSNTLAWTVAWVNSQRTASSTSAWSGIYKPAKGDSCEAIHTTWLLAKVMTGEKKGTKSSSQKEEGEGKEEGEEEKEEWNFTSVGSDIFTRALLKS